MLIKLFIFSYTNKKTIDLTSKLSANQKNCISIFLYYMYIITRMNSLQNFNFMLPNPEKEEINRELTSKKKFLEFTFIYIYTKFQGNRT